MKITVKKIRKTKDEKLVKKLLEDDNQKAWENGDLGKDPNHMEMSDITLSGKSTSLRLADDLKMKLTVLVRKKALSTHSFIVSFQQVSLN